MFKLAVDCFGLPLAMHVSAADVHDGQAGIELLWQLDEASDRLQLIRADNHYRGTSKSVPTFTDGKSRSLKSQNLNEDLFPKQVVGKLNVPSDGSIFPKIEPGLRKNRRIFGGFHANGLYRYHFIKIDR